MICVILNSMNLKNKTELLQRALNLSQSGNLEGSLNIYNEILSLYPTDEPTIFNKSVILFQLRRYNETLEAIKKINSNKEQELNLLFIKASCFGYLGDIETSKKIYQEIANIIPNNNDLLVPIGTTCLQQGIYEVARDIFQKIDKSSSYIFEKNYYMGLAYKGENRLEDAIKFFGNALRIKPDYFQLYPLTAAACFQSNMTEEGDKIMKMLKDENHSFFQHVAGIVECYRSNKN